MDLVAQDKAAVKRTFKSALTLQPKQVLAVSWDVHSSMAASSYSVHFLEGVAFKASQALGLLSSLLRSVKSMSRNDLESQLQLHGVILTVEDTKTILEPCLDCAVWHAQSFDGYWCQLNFGILGQVFVTPAPIPSSGAPRHLTLFRF